MKRILILIIVISAFNYVQAQQKFPPLDKSPMDMAYFPNNYPIDKIQPNKTVEPLLARIVYSRPQKNNRVVFGQLVEYGKIWRLGANEATEIELFKDVKIAGKKLKKGRYTMYALVDPQTWTIIFNSETDVWGAFNYDEKEDVLRVPVPVEKLGEPLEAFTMEFEKTQNGALLKMAWDDEIVSLPIEIK